MCSLNSLVCNTLCKVTYVRNVSKNAKNKTIAKESITKYNMVHSLNNKIEKFQFIKCTGLTKSYIYSGGHCSIPPSSH